MKIYIIGTGMDGAATLTREAENAVRSADILIGAKRMTEFFSHLEKPVFQSYNSREIAAFADSCEYSTAAVLMSGDVGFFSGTKKLLPLLEGHDVKVIAGISSAVYFSAACGVSWEDMKFVSLHGAENAVVRHAASNEKTFFLLGGKVTAAEVCKRLVHYGMGNAEVFIGEELSSENEHIYNGSAEEFTELETSYLAVMIVVNSGFERTLRIGISDDEFIRGSVPMTKSDIRSAVISRLRLPENGVCWDIGCGTGSVTVEMALYCRSGRVYAVDKNEEAVSLTEENARKFRCDNIKTVCMSAAEAAESFPCPDRVFIGGSGGEMEAVISAAVSKNPDAVIVITAVSLETLEESRCLLEKYGKTAEITQISAVKTRKLGSHTMLSAENPVFIICG